MNNNDQVLLIFGKEEIIPSGYTEIGVLVENEAAANEYINLFMARPAAEVRQVEQDGDTLYLKLNQAFDAPHLTIIRQSAGNNAKYRLSICVDYHEERSYESHNVDYLCNIVQKEINQFGYDKSIDRDIVAKWSLVNKQNERVDYAIQVIDEPDEALNYANPLADIHHFLMYSVDSLQESQDLYLDKIRDNKIYQEIDNLISVIWNSTGFNRPKTIDDEIMHITEPVHNFDFFISTTNHLRKLHKDAELHTIDEHDLRLATAPIPDNMNPTVARFMAAFYSLARAWASVELDNTQGPATKSSLRQDLQTSAKNTSCHDAAIAELHYDHVMSLTELLPYYYNMQLATTRDDLMEMLERVKK